jgi:hypothetical protein
MSALMHHLAANSVNNMLDKLQVLTSNEATIAVEVENLKKTVVCNAAKKRSVVEE